MPKIKKEPTSYNIAGVSVRERKNKNGTITYQMRVGKSMKVGERQETEYNRSWCNKEKLYGKKLTDALNAQVKAFLDYVEEEKVRVETQKRTGYTNTYTPNTTFAVYADYVLQIKENNQAKESTLNRYHSLLERINNRMGKIPLRDITPSVLNMFYIELSKTKLGLSAKAICKVNLNDMLAPYYITRKDISDVSGVSLQGVKGCYYSSRKGSDYKPRNIEYSSAEKIVKAINTLFNDSEKLTVTNRIRRDKKLLPLPMHPPLIIKDIFDRIECTETLSQKSILEYHQLISTIMQQAENEDLINPNPARRLVEPQNQNRTE